MPGPGDFDPPDDEPEVEREFDEPDWDDYDPHNEPESEYERLIR
jgi:hypothetical protein